MRTYLAAIAKIAINLETLWRCKDTKIIIPYHRTFSLLAVS